MGGMLVNTHTTGTFGAFSARGYNTIALMLPFKGAAADFLSGRKPPPLQ
jgi:hypothetical protein